MSELLTVTDISRQTSIPETTIRRYINLFYDFIGLKEKSVNARNKKYSKDVLNILSQIYGLYSQGKCTNEIYEILKENFSHTLSVQPIQSSYSLQDNNLQDNPVFLNFIGLVNNQTEAIYELRRQLEEIKKSNDQKISHMETELKQILQQQIKAIEQTAVDVKNTMVEDKEIQKQYIEERDALILKQMRKVFEDSKQRKFFMFKKWW